MAVATNVDLKKELQIQQPVEKKYHHCGLIYG